MRTAEFRCRPTWAFLSLAILAGCGQSGPGGATFSYWNGLNECSAMKASTQQDPRAQAVADLKLRADAIERLPTAGVDMEASRIGLAGARLLREQAMLAEQGAYLPAAAFVDGFAWGLTGEGDPLASTAQYSAGVSSWGGRYQTWCDDAQRVRVQLTNKYGTEFPNLIRSTSTAQSPATATSPSWWAKRSWFQKLLFVVVAGGLLIRFLAGLAGK